MKQIWLKLMLMLIVLFLFVPLAMGAHTFDNKSITPSWTNANPYTLSYTAGAGSTVMVLSIATATTTARMGGAPTYNGIAFTQINSSISGGKGRIEMWYLLNPPTGSAYTVSVPNTDTLTMNYMVSTYKSSTGISAFDVSASKSGTEINPSQSVTTTTNGDVVIDALFDGSNRVPTANSHTLLYSSDNRGYSNNGQYHLQAAAGAITLDWTTAMPVGDYALITAAFKEISPMNITSHGNNYTDNNTLSITVNQSTVVSFNLTANNSINSNTTSIPAGVTSLSNSSPGGMTFFSNFSFPYYGAKFVNLTITNTTGGSDYRNWSVTVNDVTPPYQVTNLTNTTLPTTSTVHLGWDAGTDNAGGSGIKDYLIDVMNNSINWSAVERPEINATGIAAGYKNDSYWYTFRNNVPVNCSNCHETLGTREFAIGNFWLKFNATYLYAFAHPGDNDTDPGDNYVKFGFDPLMDGGNAPQTDDRLYKLYENGTMITYSGNGSAWVVNAPLSNISAVKGGGSNGLRFEMAIPLSEIGSPVNGSSVRFIFESGCKNHTDFLKRSTFFPATGSVEDPSTWTLLTYRNSTQWDNLGTSTVNEYSVNDLLSNSRYGFSVRARDIALNIASRSAAYFGQTADRTGYNVTGFVTSSGTPLAGAHLAVGEYHVSTITDGSYTLSDLANGSYTINVTAAEMEDNSTGITISGADQVLNFSLNDTAAPSVSSNTNNAYFANSTLINLSATITDQGSGVKNATVNVSRVNSTINEAVLTNLSGFWTNTSIIADIAAGGFVNLTITAYDNASNRNNSINMTVWIDAVSPNVTSNTNNRYFANNSLITLNASLTDTGSGVKNVTVNVSQVSSTTNEALLNNFSGFWINNTITADKITSGFVNLTITAYDNAGNVNQSVNMTVWIDGAPPSVTSNTNNAYFVNNSLLALNATITDTGSGLHSVFVDVSQVNSSLETAVLTNVGGFWTNNTIIADIATDGFVNLTITAYDNASNVNNSVNMSVWIIVPAYIPPSPASLASSQGSFWINYTWQAGAGNETDSYNISLINNSIQYWINGSSQNWTNSTIGAHNWSNISVYAYNTSGTGTLNATPATNNTQAANNVPVQTAIGNKTVTAGNWLNFTVSAVDDDGDTITYGTNATNGSLNPSTGNFNWSTGSGDVGTYVWHFNSSDGYGGSGNETITISVTTAPTYGVNLTIDSISRSTSTVINASYTLVLQNNGTATDTYNLTIVNADSASTAVLNRSENITLTQGASQALVLNVTNISSGTFRVNVTARSNNDSNKVSYVNTTTIVPIVIRITNPAANGSTNKTGSVNVTVTLDATGLAQYLNWQGVNYSMTPNTSQNQGTVFYKNMTGLLSGNYTFKIYATDSSGVSNVSETWIVTVNMTNSTSLSIDPVTNIVNKTVSISAPSRNVTLTIFNSTNATLNGNPITEVSIDSLAQVNQIFVSNLSSREKLAGENLSVGPKGARFSPDIQMRFNYTDEMLEAAGIIASQLRVKFYNTTTNTWIEQTPYTLNETGKYIIANVSHFTIFALIGTTTTTTITPATNGGNGGTGSGGGGVSTSEPFDNIAKAERHEKSLTAGKPVTYSFTAPEHGVYEIVVTGQENENDIALRVEALKGTSKLVSVSPPGVVYKNLNIWAGTKRIKDALIRFKVENSWLTSNNIASGNVKMVRWESGKWVQLDTTHGTKDNSFTYYEAKTDGLSVFAIVGLKEGEVVPTATPKPTPVGDKTPVTEPAEKKSPGFGAVSIISAMVLMAALRMRKRERR